ncbi:PepSY-associated TM helix domain-containing protein [Desulfopila sp. IMCC35008]|uniref:PepSY-associated TM helix domain-containing protein n=1 Tax=Desulfopila sp. IMCC35008 TaxID=2653858 RepID=UPI0013D72BE5|nr:PepSY-associated TM helix domain-containing protein [Desulfopila sp. IMCC35008]
MRWRRINNIIHRDLGYLCFGLTIIYAVSGLAVNHIADWNPNYRIERLQTQIDPAAVNDLGGLDQVQTILELLDEKGQLKNSHQVNDETLLIFVKHNNINVNLATGMVTQEKSIPRKILYEMNFLHINHAKKLWTWFADLYAVSLGLLAITGLFVLRGKKGIAGRGAWLTGAGILVPIFFLWLYL